MENTNTETDESKNPTEEKEIQDGSSDSEEEPVPGEMEAQKINEENDSDIEAPEKATATEEETNNNDQTEDLIENQHFNEPNEKSRNEENIQSQPNNKEQCPNDIVGEDTDNHNLEELTDEQNCGEEKEGIGQAENEVSIMSFQKSNS